jgi:hypothetical protein
MKVASRKLLHTSVLVLFASAGAAASAAPVDCAKPSDRAEARACEAAAQGPVELHQFIWRKRAVFNLYIYDFDRAVAPYASNEQERAALAKAKVD